MPSGGERGAFGTLLRWLLDHHHGFYTTAGVVLSGGLVLALLGLWGLSELTEGVLEGDTEPFDRAALPWLEARAAPWLDRAAIEVTVMADTLVIVLVAAVAASLLWVVELRGVMAEHSAAYPSGHATMSMVTLVTIAFIVHRLSDRRRTSVLAALLTGVTILLIGLSRLYLGLHFPSDVLAGYAIGFAWAIFCAVTIEHLGQRQSASPSPINPTIQ